jgi:hypothetical protein
VKTKKHLAPAPRFNWWVLYFFTFFYVAVIQAFRRRLAEKNKCDATCPVSTSIFLRVIAEYSWEEFNSSSSTQNISPFWRALESSSPMAKKLNFDAAWIDLLRELEKQNA